MESKTFYTVGKTLITAVSTFMALNLALIIFFFINREYTFSLIWFPLLVLFSLYIYSQMLGSTITINENGIVHKSKKLEVHMYWNEISKIDVFRAVSVRGSSYKGIGFTRDTKVREQSHYTTTNENYIFAGYNRKIIKLVEKYWDKEIVKPNGLILK